MSCNLTSFKCVTQLAKTPSFADQDGREKLRSTSEIRIL
jgi:hypothetical protein